jgi:hypothetical protein
VKERKISHNLEEIEGYLTHSFKGKGCITPFFIQPQNKKNFSIVPPSIEINPISPHMKASTFRFVKFDDLFFLKQHYL